MEIVRSLLDSFVAGDLEAPFNHYADEIEFDGRHFPDGRVYRGHDGVRAFFRSFFAAFSEFELEIEAMFASGDEVVVLSRERARGRTSGAWLHLCCAQVYTLRDGKVVGWRVAT